jgi:hypothetical protein
MTTQARFITPGSRLDYAVDWADAVVGPWLQIGETITAHAVTVTGGATLESSNATASVVTAWVAAPGALVVGGKVIIEVEITTSAGRIDSRTITLTVANRAP